MFNPWYVGCAYFLELTSREKQLQCLSGKETFGGVLLTLRLCLHNVKTTAEFSQLSERKKIPKQLSGHCLDNDF